MFIINMFFFNDTATTEIYTLSLHDALPIWAARIARNINHRNMIIAAETPIPAASSIGLFRALRRDSAKLRIGSYTAACKDRKSTRLNSSHANISYAVFCLKKKTELYYLQYI